MRYSLVVMMLLVLACGPAAADDGFAGRPITTNAFAPTGYTLHRGEFAVGLGPISFGFAENLQVGTNLLLWAFQYYNADVKVAITKTDDQAFGVGIKLGMLSLDVGNSEVDFTAISPYAALSHRLGPNTMGHVGAQYARFEAEGDTDIDDADASAVASGTSFFAGIEQTYSNRTKFVADVGYDATFEGMRVGGAVLFGWRRFRVKLGISYYDAGDGFTFPLVGLWWRFQG